MASPCSFIARTCSGTISTSSTSSPSVAMAAPTTPPIAPLPHTALFIFARTQWPGSKTGVCSWCSGWSPTRQDELSSGTLPCSLASALEQPWRFETLRPRRKFVRRATPLQLLDVAKEGRIGAQGGELLEEERGGFLLAEDVGRKILDRPMP